MYLDRESSALPLSSSSDEDSYNLVAVKLLFWWSGGLASDTGKRATVKGPPIWQGMLASYSWSSISILTRAAINPSKNPTGFSLA